jgi:hypothetical protein
MSNTISTLDKYIDIIHELLIDQVTALRNPTTSRMILSSRDVFARMLGQMLFDAPSLHTGKVSLILLQSKLKDFSTKPCAEHHHGRQKGGIALLKLIDNAVASNKLITRSQVKSVVHMYCQVHYTTARENMSLRRHQKRCSSEASYRRAGVILVDAKDLFANKARPSKEWKESMKKKYLPIIQQYKQPKQAALPIFVPEMIH